MIYVDELIPHNVFGHKYWCHLLADNINELNNFAIKKLGLKKQWFQAGSCPHYDITEGKRKLAVKLGAKEINTIGLVNIVKMWRGWKKR